VRRWAGQSAGARCRSARLPRTAPGERLQEDATTNRSAIVCTVTTILAGSVFCDLAELDGGEDGDGEVEGVGPAHRLRERVRCAAGQHPVHGGEQQEEQRDRGRERLDALDRGIAG